MKILLVTVMFFLGLITGMQIAVLGFDHIFNQIFQKFDTKGVYVELQLSIPYVNGKFEISVLKKLYNVR
jgi:hypothetical protein